MGLAHFIIKKPFCVQILMILQTIYSLNYSKEYPKEKRCIRHWLHLVAPFFVSCSSKLSYHFVLHHSERNQFVFYSFFLGSVVFISYLP